MNEFNHEEIVEHTLQLKESMMKQWERINQTITNFELNLNSQIKIFEEKHLKILEEIYKETQKYISEFSSQSKNLKEMIIILSNQLDYITTQQNMEKTSQQSKYLSIKEAESLINKVFNIKEFNKTSVDFLNSSITKANLSVRTTNAILQKECKIMRDVYNKLPLEFLNMKNFGKKSLNELRNKFSEKGLKW